MRVKDGQDARPKVRPSLDNETLLLPESIETRTQYDHDCVIDDVPIVQRRSLRDSDLQGPALVFPGSDQPS